METKNLVIYNFKKYFEYFKIGFKKSIEYKYMLLGDLFFSFFIGIFLYFIWKYIYLFRYNNAISKGAFIGSFADYTIGSFTFSEMMIYLIIGLLINILISLKLSRKISDVIKSGDIVNYLTRPVNFVKSLIFDSLGFVLIRLCIFFILLILLTYISGLDFPNFFVLILFIIYGFLLFFFYTVIDIIIGSLAFWLTEVWGIENSFNHIFWILSGRALPYSLFPSWFNIIIVWTPFMYLEYTFISIYLGKLSIEEILKAIGIFMIWISLLIFLMRWIYKKGFKKLVSFGG